MARQKREHRDTRQLIVESAAEQFAMWGYAGASISDIAAAVGVSKPTLYHHFADKEEIYVEIATSVLKNMTDRARTAVCGEGTAPDRLRRFMRAHAGYLQENEHAYIAGQLGFRGLRETEDRSRALELRDGYERILSDILKAGRDDGSLHFDDTRIATLMVLSTLNWMARWYRSDGPMQAIEFAERYCDMLLEGFLPRITDSVQRGE